MGEAREMPSLLVQCYTNATKSTSEDIFLDKKEGKATMSETK